MRGMGATWGRALYRLMSSWKGPFQVPCLFSRILPGSACTSQAPGFRANLSQSLRVLFPGHARRTIVVVGCSVDLVSPLRIPVKLLVQNTPQLEYKFPMPSSSWLSFYVKTSSTSVCLKFSSSFWPSKQPDVNGVHQVTPRLAMVDTWKFAQFGVRLGQVTERVSSMRAPMS